MNDFDLFGPLPTTTTLLEASAGTGKTFALTGLACRYIAEQGVPLRRLLLITFNTNAAAELRSRLYGLLRAASECLRGVRQPDPLKERLIVHLLTLPNQAEILSRISAALDDFSSATIETTHSFSHLSLRELGILGDADGVEEVSQADVLIDECAADVYLAMFADHSEPPLDWWSARTVAREVCESTLPLAPKQSAWTDFGEEVRAQFESRKRDRGILTFNDMISRLTEVLTGDDTPGGRTAAEAAVRWLRKRYAVVLVDEFQDTDPEQWRVIHTAFVAAERPTILIGDPKQSIYGFRNADILCYLEAKQLANVATLGTNYRSDEGIVDGVVSLMEGMPLGAEEIQVRPVTAKNASRFDIPPRERIWIRTVPAAALQERPSIVADDVALQIESALGQRIGERPVRLSDIAVLARTRSTANAITARLHELGYPAIQFGTSSVWHQPAADDWAALLRALAPSAAGEKRLAALTSLIGAPLETLVEGDTQFHDILHEARAALHTGGAMAAFEVIRTATGMDARLLPTPDGERTLTDLLHIGELLAASELRDPLLLAKMIDDARRIDQDSALRLSSDADAVKVMTIHAAKGLEFPIVLLPDMSASRHHIGDAFNVMIEGKRFLWLGATRSTEIERFAAEQAREEELRLLYVGLTRAKHLAVLWHEDTPRSQTGAVSAAVFRDRALLQLASRYSWPQVLPTIPGILSTPVSPRKPSEYHAAARSQAVELSTMSRTVDPHWRRTSYSGLTADLHDAPTLTADVPSGADEMSGVDVEPDPRLGQPAPLGPLPAGASFGTLVHEVLEHLDWQEAGRESRLRALIDETAIGYEATDRELLVAGLDNVVTTPLLPLTGAALADVPILRRLPELDFDLPMGKDAAATLGELAELLARYLSDDDPLVEYPSRLASSAAAPAVLSGILTGSIDVVLQLDDDSFAVFDYKTNRLAPSADDALTLGHYTPNAMAEAMMAAHYPLQAILYCAALHRHLRLRLPGYGPDKHLGGVGYLFVRGMAGPETPTVDGASCGVFGWRPSPELIVAVSELLGGHHA